MVAFNTVEMKLVASVEDVKRLLKHPVHSA